jgi:phosphatidylserine/phosphatidylglycerophosphate/cardiolipin synthase-like enzyme
MRIFLLFSLCVLSAFADRYYYVLPSQGARAEAAIAAQIGKAKNEITIAMYSFTNANLANALKQAAKNGVKITLVVDEKNLRGNLRDSKAGELAKLKNVVVKIAKGEQAKSAEYYGIMHLKIATIDEKVSIYGSANWTASAFNVNNEILFIDDDAKLAKELKGFIDSIAKNAKNYR